MVRQHPPSKPKPAAPARVQHYAVGKRIGDDLLFCTRQLETSAHAGGQCQVHIARHLDTGVLVALKLGHPVEGENDPDYKVHLREWDSYMRLGAVVSEVPNIQQFGIAAVYGRGLLTWDDGHVRPWIAMQLLGCSLDSLIGGHVSRDRTLFFRFANQMLTALQYCHHRGVLHRDVKPGNFCVDVGDAQDRVALTSAYVVLVDFGFAQSLPQSLQLQSEFGGTPDYASHRSLLSQPIGPSDDIECLGYTLLEMWNSADLPWDVTMLPDGTRNLPRFGWTHTELAGFAAKRETAWKAACAKQRVPGFLRRWIERAKALPPGNVPQYDADFRSLLDRAAGICSMEE